MREVSTRLPDEDVAVLSRLAEEAGISRAAALRQIISRGLNDWREERALEALEAGRMTLRMAADHAGVSVVEMTTLAAEAEIEVGYTADDLRRDLERI